MQNENMFDIYTYNRHHACQLENIHGTAAAISITTTDAVPAPLNEDAFAFILRIQFDDADKGSTFESSSIVSVTPMNSEDARHIIEFIELVKHQIDILVVHCDAGLSRSPGVAVALNEIYNGTRFIQPQWLNYNRHVYRTILNHYYENGYEERNETSRTQTSS